MKNNLFMTEVKRAQAADQLVIDERQQRIYHAIRLAGVLDDRNFKLEWANQELTAAYTLRGTLAKATSYTMYSFFTQQLGEPSSKLRFNENSNIIRAIDGPLKVAVRDMAPEEMQMFLAAVVHEAIGDLIIDSYSAAASGDTL